MLSVGKWNRQLGLSLIEMITTLSVLAVVTAVAVPTYVSSHKTAKVESTTMQLLSVLEVGQSESLKHHRNVYVHYIPVSNESGGCIGLSEIPEVENFSCSENEGLQKVFLEIDDLVTVQFPVKIEPTKLFYFSHMTGLPSTNSTLKLAAGAEIGKESGILIRRYSGLKGCSNTSVSDWDACPS
ncbi:prepilin-type N-terminal cleavage/methylation domain-containing protein [Enterovibrio norvegicus FF-454]|uniref:Prepilin-type N-terminal cleavage/methylation domain-containing protein n=1 Tax=Enterovibrio norvegicus FF-454 TaxID=1185651 RepID=A0A1E5BYG4_9GAMM|nr:prepilin-type N-terminal cleavage/methylation domain-containing protein [Enterovibrio norvegicus]OEE58239.1 prepilin-type N-terminal cleavage/methylation domain-containing protein [Enterovibrio norvegicus FF-454]